MSNPERLDHAVVNSFLRGLTYPVRRAELVRLAKSNDVVGPYLTAFSHLPDRSYPGQEDVMEALGSLGYRLV